jgi:hypothetical protein
MGSTAVLQRRENLARNQQHEEHTPCPSRRSSQLRALFGIDADKNTLHIIGLGEKRKIVLREKDLIGSPHDL